MLGTVAPCKKINIFDNILLSFFSLFLYYFFISNIIFSFNLLHSLHLFRYCKLLFSAPSYFFFSLSLFSLKYLNNEAFSFFTPTSAKLNLISYFLK